MNIVTIRQWETKPQERNSQEFSANFREDGMGDSHAPVPLPFKDLSLASSWSDVVFSNRLEAVVLVISVTNLC